MEIVAAVSSVAGILSLVSQGIEGASKLKDLFSNISRASITIDRFLHDIDSLLQALQAARDLVKELPTNFGGSQVTSLRIELQYCTKDVYRLLDIASSLRPISVVGAKAWFQRFWTAVNKNLLVDAREELERHKQAINLSLVVLGRNLDIHTAASVKQLDSKFEQGTTASLSKIEAQNVVLERIEAHTETSIMRSAVSDKSLHSIATSLSRIEVLASSAASAAMSQKTEDLQSPKRRNRTQRRSTGDITRARRRSGSSAISGRASMASARSLPTVPTIPEKHLSTSEPARLSEVSEASTNWNSSSKEIQTQRTSVYTESKHISLEPPVSAITDDNTPAQEPMVDVSLHQQHRLFYRLTQETVALLYPPIVVEYISLIKVIKDYESKISHLNLLNFGSNLEGTAAFQNQSTLCESDIYVLAQERNVLRDRLWALLDSLQDCRRRCVFEGHLLHNIDERLSIKRLDIGCSNRGNELLSDKIQKGGSHLLSCWSSNRDRINRWLLDCLRSDEQQAQLHRSMLADPPIDDEYWTRQVLRHWYLDEAAVGEELPIPRSVGAVDSYSIESSEPLLEYDEHQILNNRYIEKAAGGGNSKTPRAAGASGSHVAGVGQAVAKPMRAATVGPLVNSGIF